jgi:sugar lactone lactonase YvrE
MKTYSTDQRITVQRQIAKKLFRFCLLAVLLCFSACSKSPQPIIVEDNKEDKYEDPAFTSFSPLEGAMNTIITINGNGFNSVPQHNEIIINGKRASILSSTPTSMQVKVPAGAGTGKVSVRVGNSIVSSAKDFVYQYMVSTMAGDDTPGPAGSFSLIGGTAVDLAGNVYVVVKGNGTIRKISRNGEVSILAGGKRGPFQDGQGDVATFSSPHGVAVQTDGTVYVADDFNHAIRKITPDGYVTTFAGEGSITRTDGNFGFKDGQGMDARFHCPMGIAIDHNGYLYVADSENKATRKISPTGLVSTLVSNEINKPVGLAVDVGGNLYVADAGCHQIKKITPAGVVITLAGSGEKGYADGRVTTAKFSFPMDLAVDPAGNVFVSDGDNCCIRKITPAGVVTTIGARIFGVPEGIDMDAAGNLYVADTGTSKICKMTQAGVFTIIAGSGFGYEDGPALTARFRNPEGLALDRSGNIYVGDLGNAAVRKITKTGEVRTIGGGTSGFAEGIGINSKFREPAGIDIDFFGNIYVADTRNSRIRKLR